MKITALRFVRIFDVIKYVMVNHFDAATDGEILVAPSACEISEVVSNSEGLTAEVIEDFKEKWIRYVLQHCNEDISQEAALVHWPHQTKPNVECRVRSKAGSVEVRR